MYLWRHYDVIQLLSMYNGGTQGDLNYTPAHQNLLFNVTCTFAADVDGLTSPWQRGWRHRYDGCVAPTILINFTFPYFIIITIIHILYNLNVYMSL